MTEPSVTIRMYKGILGDCFLLRFFDSIGDGGRARVADRHVLIDCGALQFSRNEGALVNRVVDSIAADCGGTLDLVVVTHEHYDHICGFGRGSETFAQLDIKTLWLAWTEHPDDPLAQDLRKRHDATRQAMAMAMGMMAMHEAARHPATPGGEDADDHWMIKGRGEGLDGFIGPLFGEHPDAFALDGRKRKSSREILEDLKKWAKTIRYLQPGEVEPLPFESDIRAFVLGPPRSLDRLMQDSPAYDPDKKETYLNARKDEVEGVARNFAFAEDSGCDYPFASRHRKLTENKAQGIAADPANANAPWAGPIHAVMQRYNDGAQEHRRIDDDWQSPVGNLALKLDSDTNNTSLALAFELGKGGKVLLFAADAQVGNWLSWHDQSYPATAPADQQVDAASLLQRTVVYKVGHHGSHNATLRAKGLELMTDPALAALLPVVVEVAEKRKWRMPHTELHHRLVEKTEGRILQGDEPLDPAMVERFAAIGCAVREAPDDGSALGPLWIELDVS